jgi:hypothetical protein
MKKKIISALIIAAICFNLVACKYEIIDEADTLEEYKPSISYWVDEETGVQYLIYSDYRQGGITPRLNADGSLYIENKE